MTLTEEALMQESRAERDRLKPWIEAGKLLLITRLMYFVVAYSASFFLADSLGPPRAMLDIWSHWDARLFFLVAEHGYAGTGTDPHATAFFPLFPFLLSGMRALGFSYPLGGLIITTVGSLVAGAFLYRLVADEMGEESGRRAVLYLYLFPTGIFLVAPYSEAVFLAGAIAAFYYGRKAKWHLVGLPAAIAVGARAAGVFLLLGLVWEFVRQRNFSWERIGNAATALVAGILPLVAYGAYLARTKGNAFYYFIDQRDGWYRDFVGPVESFLATWRTWNGGQPTNWIFAWRVEIVAAAIGLGFVVWSLRKKEWGYAAYMGTFLGSLMVSSWYYSIPRMLLSFFPIMVFLAAFTARSDRRHEYLMMALVPLAMMGAIVYARGAWFY